MRVMNIIAFLLLAALPACNTDEPVSTSGGLVIKPEDLNIEISHKVFSKNIVIKSDAAWTVESDRAWCRATADNSTGVLALKVDENTGYAVRKAIVSVTDGSETQSIFITQNIVPDYTPGDAGQFTADTEVVFAGVALTPYLVQGPGYSPEKTIDGVIAAGNLWHSGWNGIDPSVLPFVLEYTLKENTAALDYIVIYPRTAGDGVPQKVNIYVSTAGEQEYVLSGQLLNEVNSGDPLVFYFPETVVNPAKVKLEILSALQSDTDNYKVCICEFKGFARGQGNTAPGIFTDGSCSELKPEVTMAQINAMDNGFLKNVAYFLFTDNYEGEEFRIQEYGPYRPIDDLKKELKISGYSQFENPTGMFFDTGETAMVFLSGTEGRSVYLRVTNFGNEGSQYGSMQSDNRYLLSEGANKIVMKGNGNGYISYFTPDYKTAPDIKVHIASGKTVGYFDISKHDNDDWARITALKGEVLDMKGRYVMLSFQREGVVRNTPVKGVELMELYDDIVSQQYDIMGLHKYGRVPKNRMFGRSKYDNGNPWADGYGMAYPHNSINMYASADGLTGNGWGVYHELGHVNQVRPGFKWKGTTEVTNNLYSMWNQYNLNPENTRLETTAFDAGDGLGKVTMGYFNSFLMNTVYKDGGLWLGQDNVFCRLVPLWQLQLYYGIALGKTAYQDFFETIRMTSDVSDDGQNQANFAQYFSDAAGENLTDFFNKSKILVPFTLDIDDYGIGNVTITRDMADKTESAITGKRYPAPASAVIYYCTAKTVEIFKNKKLLANAAEGAGVSISGGKAVISNAVWQNAVAFEACAGDSVIGVSVSYTGSGSGDTTMLAFAADADNIKAVAWDGTRKIIYRK